MRTMPEVGPLLQPFEDKIRHIFIPALTGRPSCSDLERLLQILSLPARLGGLGFNGNHQQSQESERTKCKEKS